MRRNPKAFRLTATVALTALLWDSILPLAAVAQPAPPPLPPGPGQGQYQPDQNQADPPARVGRIASITGAVSFHNQGDTQWTTASVNYPVSSGNAFWTQPMAETQLEVSNNRITLASGTEFDIYALDAAGLQGVAVQGETYLNLRDLALNEFGLLARTVFRTWGINRTDDFGELVFNLVEAGLMSKTSADQRQDFHDVYDLDKALVQDYRIEVGDEVEGTP